MPMKRKQKDPMTLLEPGATKPGQFTNVNINTTQWYISGLDESSTQWYISSFDESSTQWYISGLDESSTQW